MSRWIIVQWVIVRVGNCFTLHILAKIQPRTLIISCTYCFALFIGSLILILSCFPELIILC